MSDDLLSIVIDKAGGATKLGRALGISHQAILKWPKVPATRVLEVERLTGVSRHALRPDVFGPLPSSSDRHPSAVSQAGA